jgi:hypothetical protein
LSGVKARLRRPAIVDSCAHPGPPRYITFFELDSSRSLSMTSRRAFIQIVPLATVATLGLASVARAADAPKVDEKDPQAAGLGYTADAARLDKAKFPKYAPGQACGACQLYSGKPGDAFGGCAIFAGKQVASRGWCNAYTKRA